jgi:hypothetical protein
MTGEQPTVEYDLVQESSAHRFAWTAAALAVMLAVGAGVWGWTAQNRVGGAEDALASALGEREQAVAEARQWRTLLDQAESAAQATDAKVAELEQRVQSLDELLQTANMEVSRLESELAARTPEEASGAVTSEPLAAIGVAEGFAAGSLGAVAPETVEPAAAPPAEPAPAEAVAPAPVPAPARLAIVFDVNSSYLPASLDGRLRDLAAGLDPGYSYRVELVGSVGHPDVEGQPAEEALRYNRWMAERRMTRVAEYLQKNTKAEKLSFRQDFALNDPSRRVLIEVLPVRE